MRAQLIDGKSIAISLRQQVASGVVNFKSMTGRRPGLAVVLVGDNAASKIYVRNKVKQAEEVGILSLECRLPEAISESSLLAKIDELNADDDVHGILVQLPLPPHVGADAVLQRVRPDKDVDGFHPLNVGKLVAGLPSLVPCTPSGIVHLIRSVRPDITGCNVIVLGRSSIVGKPLTQLMCAADATVTLAHSKTRDLVDLCRNADILIAAVGRPKMVRGDWIKAGGIVIDVGINRVTDPKPGIVGDVDFDEAVETAGWITPVPGGVGPMTIACLLENTLIAAKAMHFATD